MSIVRLVVRHKKLLFYITQLLQKKVLLKKDSRLEFYNEMIRTGKHPSTGEKLSKAEKTNAQLMIYSLVLQPFVGAYSASKFNQQKNVAGNGGKSSGGADFSKPKHFLDDALKQQGLNKLPEKLKQKWTYGEYNYEVRVHPGDSKYTEDKTTYRASRKIKPIQGKQGSGIEYMDKNGKWWHQSELREFNGDGTLNPLFNKDAAKNTHIPMD